MTEVLRAVGEAEPFTAEERARLAPYFTSLDGPVFALINLPETVKGALFARYSRSAKSLRRLFLDEFADKVAPDGRTVSTSRRRSRVPSGSMRRVFSEYGDDSVAQLGGAHIACEYASNVLTKVLEWGRLMAYLEQSTRYVAYTDRRRPLALSRARGDGTGALHDRYAAPWTRRSTGTRSGFRGCRRISRPASARRERLRGGLSRRDPRQGARHAARAAAGRHAVERRAYTAADRPSKRCCSACAPIRWPRCVHAPTTCSASCERSSRRSSRGSINRIAADVVRVPGVHARTGRRARLASCCKASKRGSGTK